MKKPFRSRPSRPSLFLLTFLLAAGVQRAGGQQPPRTLHADPATLAQVLADSREGEAILLAASPTAYGPIALKPGQSLTAEAAPVTVHTLTIADGASLKGFAIDGTLEIRGRRNVTVAGVTIDARDASALVIADSSVDATFERVDVTVAGTKRVENGVSLENVTGKVTINGGTLRNVTQRGVSIVKSANVTLRNLSLIGSAAANGIGADLCGNSLEAGANAKCSAAIFLQDASDITLDKLTIDGSAQTGINGLDVKNFALTNSELKGSGNELHEHALLFRNLLGDVKLENVNVHHSASRGLYLFNGGGESTIAIAKSTFSDAPQPATGQQGVLIAAAGDAKLALRVEGSTFARTFGAGLQVDARERSEVAATIQTNTFDTTAGLSLTAIGAASLTFDVADNALTNSSAVSVNVLRGSPSTGNLRGTIVRNQISAANGAPTACPACDGIGVNATGTGRADVTIADNVLRKVGNAGIRVVASGATNVTASIQGNTLRDPVGTPQAGIRVQAGTGADDTASVCAVIGGAGDRANTIAAGWANPIDLANRFPKTHVRLPGFAGKGTDLDAVARYVAPQNRNAAVRAALTKAPEGNAFEGGSPCQPK
ncbi:MAG: right-handed parallel beta-helix repeat-containing protein [Acidobacteria bacterium]|nr:right-handed parallel beta-helix repeat-containing protein [Acidobacteriota bacterium]